MVYFVQKAISGGSAFDLTELGINKGSLFSKKSELSLSTSEAAFGTKIHDHMMLLKGSRMLG